MKSYLQRLAARAEGVAMTPSLVPARRDSMRGQADPDPFLADETAASSVQSTMTRGDIHDNQQRQFAGEIVQTPTAGPLGRRSRNAESPSAREEAENQSSFGDHAATIYPPRLRTETALSGSPTFERGDDALEEDAGVRASNAQLFPTPAIDVSLATPGRNEGETVRLDAPTTLEPRLTETVRPQAPAPDEPRLVIGQLRVDVIPTAPSPAREVVRMVTRTVGSNQSGRLTGPISKLRFGLGQM